MARQIFSYGAITWAKQIKIIQKKEGKIQGVSICVYVMIHQNKEYTENHVEDDLDGKKKWDEKIPYKYINKHKIFMTNGQDIGTSQPIYVSNRA